MKRKIDKSNRDFNISSYNARHSVTAKRNTKKSLLKILYITLAVITAIVIATFIYIKVLLGNINRERLEGDLGINSGADLLYEDYTNIALFGLDTREDNDEGRSDAIMVLSFDKKHDKIKMISIARDSYVDIELSDKKGNPYNKKDKITHAWSYDKHNTAVKTINQNYNLNITDFVSMNFYQFSDVIDYVGGVTIDVSRAEMSVMNKTYIPYIKKMGIDCEYLKSSGVQRLSGGQALAYARDRYTGSDIERGSRQREVMLAMYEKVKDLNVSKYPELIKMVLKNCSTSLTDNEMMSLASWTATNTPEFDQLGIPVDVKSQTIDGISYVVYDLDDAALEIQNFLHETGNYASKSEKDK